MDQSLENQRAAWPGQNRQRDATQPEGESTEWVSTSSSSGYTWSFPPHSAVRVPGLTMTSAGGIRPRYSPPPFMSPRDYTHIERPGVREQCWQRCAALNAGLPRDSIIQPRDVPAEDQLASEQATRTRAASSASRVSRMMSAASIRSRRSVSSVSSVMTNAASGIARNLSAKGKSVVSQVMSRSSGHHVDKSIISRPLSQHQATLDGALRTDFSAFNQPLPTSYVVKRSNSASSGESRYRFEPGRLKRQIGRSNLQQRNDRRQSAATRGSSYPGENNYQKFLAAAHKQGQLRQGGFASMAALESGEDITMVIEGYLEQETDAAKL